MAAGTDEERIRRMLHEIDEGGESDADEEDILEGIFSDNSDDDPDFQPSNEGQVIDEATKIQHIEQAYQQTEKQKRKKKRPRLEESQSSSSSSKVADKVGSEISKLRIVPTVEELIGKKGFTWKTKEVGSNKGKTRDKNIVHVRPGPTQKIDPDPEKCFNLLLSDNILDEIVLRTNEEIVRQRKNYKVVNATLKDVCKEELRALIGLLFLTAALNNNHLSAKLLFDSKYSGDLYRATMTAERFLFLINCIRFDDRETRNERREESKLAPIKKVWDLFVMNCSENYQPSSFCTIDEQLVGFRGRCPFRVYMPKKPNRYGIKILMICDNDTKYMFNAIPYLGKGSSPEGVVSTHYFVEKLVESLKGSHRNITMDNWFVSIPLFEKLLKEYGLSAIGTIKKNKPELPSEFVDIKYQNRNVDSSLFLFSDNLTAVSYKPKANKLVTLISTMHDDGTVDEKSKKPDIILAYNETKGAVDTLDQMCQHMSCSRKTRRWPLCLFYNILNLTSVNSYVIYVHQFFRNSPNSKKVGLSRQEFLLHLHSQLTTPWITRRRAETPTLRRELKTTIDKVLGTEEPHFEKAQKGERKYCGLCHYRKRRFTTTYCSKCNKPICGEHQVKMCPGCK
ncbi:piggyBac transposable element-derived protein 4-like [Nilaparvata lugens]|uniref:piggyBac transposable element-derived protein 4-like n=1 Tax=Nilaparvata lugens TaxID=108931 RepID=UPI00193DFD41|nr:piggyBac transposable element-derived protein 4-like [Nilaparvata lugens]